jgi:hypothetical protein
MKYLGKRKPVNNNNVLSFQAASIRALGVFVLYPVLRDDAVFVTDVANAALNGLNDAVLLVRMRTAWSLANLSDALVINK